MSVESNAKSKLYYKVIQASEVVYMALEMAFLATSFTVSNPAVGRYSLDSALLLIPFGAILVHEGIHFRNRSNNAT